MNSCRIIITTECNLKCDYCCNRMKDIQDKFKMVTMDQVSHFQYKNYSITGGEPLLELRKMHRLCELIRTSNPKAKIFVYTNGILLDSLVRKLFCGVVDHWNIGFHGQSEALWAASEIPNSTLYFEKGAHKEIQRIYKGKIKMKTWVRNECRGDNEDWFII